MASKRAPKWLLAAISLAMPLFAQAKSKFADTTSGTVENQGGIQDSELNADTQKLIQRFRDGRKSSAQDMRSRYSGILEMHDEDFDGLTDHDHPGNSLEGGMEEAAVGHRGGDGEKRQKELEKARASSGRCKYDEKKNWAYMEIANPDKTDTQNPTKKIACPNYSAVLVDKGSAHGHSDSPEEEHRALDITAKAYEKASQAGKDYATRSIQEATDWGTQNNTNGAQGIRSSDGYYRQVEVTRDGQTTKVEVGANIDLLKSEAAWLGQQKKREIDLEWQSIRAARLAGSSPNDKEALREFTEILGQTNKSQAQIQQEVAQRINERQKWGSDTLVCPGGSLPDKQGNCGSSKASDVGVPLKTFAASDENKDKADKIYAQLRSGEAKSMSASDKKDEAKQIQTIQSCMERGAWCYGPNQVENHAVEQGLAAAGLKSVKDLSKPENQAKQKAYNDAYNKTLQTSIYQKAKGDPGGAFDDDREYIFSSLSIATEGPLDKFEKTMTSWDFNKSTDNKARDTRPYEKMMKEIQQAKQAVADTKKSEQEAAAQAKANGLDYQTNYDGAMFDSSKQSVQQLFGRNLQRDGSTLAGTMPAPGQAMPQPQQQMMRGPANYQAYPGMQRQR